MADMLSDEDVGLMSDDQVGLGSAQQDAPAPAMLSDADVGLMSDDEVGLGQSGPAPEGALASGARAAAHSALPTLGSLPAMGAGAVLGAPLGPVGAFVGGLAGAIGGGYAVSKAQDWVGKQLGFDDADQLAANAEAHPLATGVGELVPAAAAFRPDLVGLKIAQRLAGGGIMGGLELGQEAAGDQPISPGKVAGAAAFGAVFNKPTKMAEAAMGLGGKLAGRLRPNATPQSAPGSAAEATPPPEDAVTPGDSGYAATRSDRDYGVTRPPAGDNQVTTGIMDPATMDALKAGLDRNDLRKNDDLGVVPGREPEEQLPLNTGIAEAAAQQPAPAPVTAAVTPPEPTADQLGAPKGRRAQKLTLKPAEILSDADVGLENAPVETGIVEASKQPPSRDDLPAPGATDAADAPMSDWMKANRQGAVDIANKLGVRDQIADLANSGKTAKEISAALEGRLDPNEVRAVRDDLGIAPAGPSGSIAMGNMPVEPVARAKTLTLNKDIAAAAKEVNRNPTEGQKGAGNYKKGHVNIDGLGVSIENPRGSLRKGVDANGEPWSVKMPDHYGYIRKTEGADGDHVDAYIGKGDKHFIADQYDAKTGKFDEHKLLLKQPDRETALANYDKAFSDGKGADRLGAVREVTMPELKEWLKGDTTKPANGAADFPLKNKPLDLTGFTEGVRVQPRAGAAPKVVGDTIAKLRERGMAKAADAIEALPPARQRVEAARAAAAMTNKTGKVPEKVTRLRARPAAPSFKAGDQIVTGRSKADVERKTNSLKAVNEAFEKHPPAENESKDAAVQRLQGALQTAKDAMNGGDPLAYKPREKPKEYMWLRAADRFLAGSKTDAAYDKFRADELQLRSGNREDVANVRNTNRIEGDIGRSRSSGDDAIANAENENARHGYLDVPHEEAETMVKPEPIESPADIKPIGKRKLDLTTEEGRADAAQQSQKIVDNLIKMEDGEKKIPQWQQAAEDRAANMDKQRRAREAAQLAGKKTGTAAGESEGAASPVRKIAVTPEMEKAIKSALEKSQARDKARASGMDALPAERDPTKPTEESKLKEFWNNEKGELNLNKIRNQFKAMIKPVRASLEKYFGAPMTDLGIKIDSVLARTMATTNKWSAEKAHLLDARWYMWMKGAKTPDVMKYLSVLEDPAHTSRADVKRALESAGIDPKKADWMADEGMMHKSLMDQVWLEDRAHGSSAEYIANYVPHIFKDPKGAAAFIESRVKALGATWYQKTRTFDLIEEAVRDGKFELKFDNPIDILGARWAASINSNMLVNSARGLQDIGAAFPAKDAPAFAKKNWKFKRQLPDGQQWLFAPEAENLWLNAMEAKGLTQMDGPIGSVYRNWMKLKTVWVPIVLSLSAFHPLHVLANIHPAQQLTTALRLSAAGKGSYGGNLLRAAKWSLADPLFAMPIDKIGFGLGKALDEMAGKRFSNFEGRRAMDMTGVEAKNMSAYDKAWSQLEAEGGFSPHQAQEEVIGAKRAWAKAINDKEYIKAIPAGIRRAIEKAQEPLFKYTIPALKNISYRRAVSAAMQIDPTLVNDNVRRGVALREIAKNIDDRYGEMFYKSLFWNRYVKDIGIGSMLSLSWNLGQFRQLSGAIGNAARATRLGSGANGLGSPMQEARYHASDKAAFVSSYVGLSMASAGMLSYALTGSVPTGLDYFFPRNGQTNPDGRPQRLSTPFNTREPFMWAGHSEQHNSWVGGALEFLWNKMILSPITEAMENRDFYGQKLYDVNAPWYKKALQGIDSTLGSHFSPIAISGADRAREQGGSPGLAYLGFGPAPKYISATPMENRINAQFSEEGTPTSKPYEYGAKTGLGRGLVQGAIRSLANDPLQSEARKTDRAALDRAGRAGDTDAALKARRDLIKNGGMSPRTASRLDPRQEFQYKFARLPGPTQEALARDMTDAEFNKYVILNVNAGVQKVNKAKMMKERSLKKGALPSR